MKIPKREDYSESCSSSNKIDIDEEVDYSKYSKMAKRDGVINNEKVTKLIHTIEFSSMQNLYDNYEKEAQQEEMILDRIKQFSQFADQMQSISMQNLNSINPSNSQFMQNYNKLYQSKTVFLGNTEITEEEKILQEARKLAQIRRRSIRPILGLPQKPKRQFLIAKCFCGGCFEKKQLQ